MSDIQSMFILNNKHRFFSKLSFWLNSAVNLYTRIYFLKKESMKILIKNILSIQGTFFSFISKWKIIYFYIIVVLALKSNQLSITYVNFGEYIGSYEGFKEMGLMIPQIGYLKSSNGKTTPAPEQVITTRRYRFLWDFNWFISNISTDQ